MLVKNKTHYYSFYNKTYNVVPDSQSWEFESSKRLSYGQRLYWEYKYCKSVGGQAFFYTFTYNNNSLPYFEFERYSERYNDFVKTRIPCFNYNHIRLITNGIISKVLRRKYGSQLRYFVACERGEGKGFRGKGLNPHYHVIFFIFPLLDKVRKDKDVPYKRISPIQFCHLCKCVWQYQSTYNKSDYVVADYKSAKFGHCQPGNDLGLITDFDALSYVTKYVVKDSAQYVDDRCIESYYARIIREKGYTFHSLYSFYHYLRFTGSIVCRQDFFEFSGLDKFFCWRALSHRRDIDFLRYLQLQYPFLYDDFMSSFKDYYNRIYLPAVVRQEYHNYLNMYGSKVRCSKSLGIYGLSFVRDEDVNPHFVLDKSNQVVTQPICLYYYRKKYMDVVRCPYTNNVLYVLNDKGIDLKAKLIPSVISRFHSSLSDSINAFSNNKIDSPLWNFALSKDLKYDDFKSLCSEFDLDSLLYEYSVYHNVYEYRSYPLSSPLHLNYAFDTEDIVHDYVKFLSSNFYTCDYSELYLITLVEFNRDDGIVCCSEHSCFKSVLQKFAIIQRFYDVYKEFVGSIKKKAFDDAKELRGKVNAVKYSRVNSL